MSAEQQARAQEIAKAVKAEKQERTTVLESQAKKLSEALAVEKSQREKDIALRDRKPYQSYRRRLTAECERQLRKVWCDKLGISLVPGHLRFLQHRVSYLEDLCMGRLAGHVEDAVLRLLLGISYNGDKINILEIGTLFGVSSIILYDVLTAFNKKVGLTLIDPLKGYYANDVDVDTGMPVTLGVLEKNLDRAMVPHKDRRIIQAYSTDPGAVAEASKKLYQIVFIDGDHGYEGVKKDFELYGPLVAKSGYLIFDDYHNKAWPDVTKVVDDIVMKSPDFEHVGSEWETAVFRRKPKTQKK